MRLTGKNTFVTGGSRGIGKSICIALAENGANVAFTFTKDTDSAKQTLSELLDLGIEARSYQADVRNRSELKECFQELENIWGSIDVLVNNAGINKPTDLDKINDKDWDEIISVNLKGPFVVTQEIFPLLIKSGSASIINIGSVSGQYGGPRTAHYAASKAGLISLGQVFARFGSQYGVRSNTLSAGLIASDMAEEGLKSSSVKKAAESIILKRLGTYTEVADTVIFLASDESKYITAQTINVNGGLYF